VSPRFAPHPPRRPAVVTGASSGIGAATAEALAAAGHPVVLGARRVQRCEEIAQRIRADGGEAIAAHLDLADQASIKDFAGASDAFGPVEVLVSNAGDTQLGHGIDTPPDDFAQQVQVNFLGVQYLVSLIAPGMVDRHRGDLVFVTTDSISAPRPGMTAYVSAKWGVEGLAKLMQMELEGTGVRVCVVRPGPTATEMGSTWEPDKLGPLFDEWARFGGTRHDSFLRPEHMARVIANVVSMPRGSYIASVEVQPEAPGPDDLKGGSP
jgi:NAD(P)-dependent dehydrogenase (short-subunit alcohol dehydrogenase family)